MNQFEAVIDNYPSDNNLKDFIKLLDTAKQAFKEDLAPFEIDWMLECLFRGRVQLPTVLSVRRREDVWSAHIVDTFLLFSDLVARITDHLEPYAEDIHKMCMAVYTPHVRRRAVQCLAEALSHGLRCPVVPRALMALLVSTDEPLSCRVPVAELIGTVCERSPELVGDCFNDIWRSYLCVLEGSKTTDSLINGVLIGMNGLLKHFGVDLSVMELNIVYDNITSKFIYSKPCEQSSITLIATHASLFPEKILADNSTHNELWRRLERDRKDYYVDALYSIYRVRAENFDREALTDMIMNDLYPKTFSKLSQISNAAYKILSDVIRSNTDTISHEFVQKYHKDVSQLSSRLEFHLQQKLEAVDVTGTSPFEYDHDLVHSVIQASWIVLHLLLLLYRQCAPAQRRASIVHSVLKCASHLRAGAISFLIGECCQPSADKDAPKAENIGRLMPIWRDLFDSQNGKDSVVLERSKHVFEDFLTYLIFFVETVLDKDFVGDVEETKNKLSILLILSAQILQLENVKDWMASHTSYVLECTLECVDLYGISEGVVAFITELLDEAVIESYGEDVRKSLRRFYHNLRTDRCSDEGLVCVSCLAIVQAPEHCVEDVSSALNAFKFLFSRNDVDGKVMLKALERFQRLLETETLDCKTGDVSEIMCLLEKLRLNRDCVEKDDRVLHRDVVLFLGSYGSYYDINNSTSSSDVSLKSVKECLFLYLPNYSDGSNLKINLQRMLDLALVHENPEALHAVLLVVCANAETLKKQPNIECVLVAIIHRMCRCWSRGDGSGRVEDLEHSVLLFDCTLCAKAFIECIRCEPSPGVRNMLASVLESSLELDPLSDATQEAVRMSVERTALMLSNELSITKRSGLVLTSTIVNALKSNNVLTKEYLPQILLLTSSTNEMDFEKVFHEVAEYFFEKMELFDTDVVENVCEELLKNLLMIEYDEYIYHTLLDSSLDVIRKISSNGIVDYDQIFDIFTKHFDVNACDEKVYFAKAISILAKMRYVFDVDVEARRKMALYMDYIFLERSLKWSDTFYSKCQDVDGYFLHLSIFGLLEQYADVFLEFKYQKTIELLSIMISTMPVLYVNKSYKQLLNCMKSFRTIWKSNPPHTITNSIHMWIKSLQIANVTDQLKTGTLTNEVIKSIKAVKLILNIVDMNKTEAVFNDDIYEGIKSWPNAVLHLHAKAALVFDRSKMAALTGAVKVALFFMRDGEIIKLIDEGQLTLSNGVTFCQMHIAAFADWIVNCQNLRDDSLKPHLTVLLYELLKYFGRKKCDSKIYESILSLIDAHWSVISMSEAPTPLQTVQAMANLGYNEGLSLNSGPGRWLLQCMSGEDVQLTQRIKYMEALSAFLNKAEDNNPLLDAAIKRYCEALPRRVSELCARSDPRALLAALHALAVSGHPALRTLLANMAAGEESSGWWDHAMESCMRNLAARGDVPAVVTALALYDTVEQCRVLSSKLCARTLVPLLRYSSQRVNEEYFSATLPRTLRALRLRMRGEGAGHAHAHALVRYTDALALMAVMLEKVSSSSLESATSQLHTQLEVERTWYLPSELCKLCLSLRTIPRPGDSAEIYRQFQCANYKCMAAALSKRRPDLKFYEKLFSRDVWKLIVDCDRNYVIYIDVHGKTNSKRHMVSVETTSVKNVNLTLRSTLTSRPLFLQTLSDNPLQYDLLNDYNASDEIETQELLLSDNDLNSHECSATLTAILCHLSSLTDDPRPYWIAEMAAVISNDEAPRNVKWFLSQVIMNCKEELGKCAPALVPALLRAMSATPYDRDGRLHLNGLHINIFKTVIYWSQANEQTNESVSRQTDKQVLSKCVQLLIDTCFHHQHSKYVLKTLTGVLNEFVKLYGGCLRVAWEKLKASFEASDTSTQAVSLYIVTLLTKNGIYIPELLPSVVGALHHQDKVHSKMKEVAELFGLAAAMCQDDSVKRDGVRKFRSLLDRIRQKDVNVYVKMLYYAQSGYGLCVDEHNFRLITDLAPKMAATNKDKCFAIMSTYVSNLSSSADLEHVTDMFDSVNLTELILDRDAKVAVQLASSGLGLMSEELKRRVVLLVCDVCAGASKKVRIVGYELLLKAFRDTIPKQEFKQPPPKRARHDAPASRILHCWLNENAYTSRILATLARAAMDGERDISDQVQQGMLEFLNTNDLALRFCEVLALTLVLPFAQSDSTGRSPSAVEPRGCVRATVALWSRALRDNEAYKRKLLRDEPLNNLNLSDLDFAAPSKLLTMGTSYQGTLRSGVRSGRGGRARARVTPDDQCTEINVQVPLDDVFMAFVGFAQKSLESSSSLLVEIFHATTKMAAYADVRGVAAAILSRALCTGAAGVPALLAMARLVVADCVAVDGFLPAVEKLYKRALGSEGERSIRLLYEEAMLHTDVQQLLMFSNAQEDDVTMSENSNEFSIDDVTAMFGELANWDDLTMQQQDKLRSPALPTLWTDTDSFVHAMGQLQDDKGWVSRLYSAYTAQELGSSHRWLREMDVWPRRIFNVSAVTEAVCVQTRELNEVDDWKRLPSDIKPSDCLVEWAVRLMIRSVKSRNDGETLGVSRSHELRWCEEANRRSLTQPVLHCIDRNVCDLMESETLPWLLQQVTAMRSSALMVHDRRMLEKALQKAETNLETFRGSADAATVARVDEMILRLSMDLKSLSVTKMADVLSDARAQCGAADGAGGAGLRSALAAHEMALAYCCNTLARGLESDVRSMFKHASECLGFIVKYGLTRNNDAYIAALLRQLGKINDKEMHDEAALCMFDQLEGVTGNCEEPILRALAAERATLSGGACAHLLTSSESVSQTETCVSQLKLLRCPDYTLEQHCEALLHALASSDTVEWVRVFDAVYSSLFDVTLGGASYHLLNRYKSHLEGIRQFKQTSSFKQTAEKALKNIIRNLKLKEVKSAASLHDLCPSLAAYPSGASERDRRCLRALLCVRDGLSVVRFEKQVHIFTNSIKRPVLVRVLLSDGRTTSHLVKSGEDLRTDAACQQVQGYLNRVSVYRCATYNVTPLGKDAGIIEYLEDHVTIRSLLAKSYPNLKDIGEGRVRDEQLILQPAGAAAAHHATLCQRIPAHALRSCIWNECDSVQDFIVKKGTFLNSLSAMTILHWLLDVSDRHTENMMYGAGRACGVDWAGAWQLPVGDTARVPELPPARLTRLLAAVDCRPRVLESRLQNVLAALNQQRVYFSAVVDLAFKWRTDYTTELFQDRLTRMDSKLRGSVLPHQVTVDMLAKSNLKYKEKYIEILDNMFEDVSLKEEYCVEEQVMCLLRQCTDVRVLAVTRVGWEPWL